MKMTIIELKAAIELEPARSAWDKGVKEYALELVDTLSDSLSAEIPTGAELQAALLNGAQDWNQYSWGGCALIYDEEIAERLCSPSELRKTRNGQRRPNSREEWLDTQARALSQAARMIMRLSK
jgi:hypothetical protein